MSRLTILTLTTLLSACGGPDATGTPGGTPSGTTAPGLPTGTVPTGTGDTATTSTLWTWTTPPWEEPVDCSAALPLPLTATSYGWVPSHEDFTFSPDGDWVGTVGDNLNYTPWGGPTAPKVLGVGGARGTRFLPDGTVVSAGVSTGTLERSDPATGTHWTIQSGLTNPNGIAIGVDGKVYIATTGRILRIDPDTEISEVVAEISGRSFDGLTFSPDYTRLYFNEEIGRLNYVDFDEDGVPGEPVTAGSLPTGASLLDGMTVDACGNLYAVVMSGKVYRVTPTAEVELLLTIGAGAFTPALNFGPGVGGFEKDHLYVQDFLGRMHDIEVGIPGKWEPHLPWQ